MRTQIELEIFPQLSFCVDKRLGAQKLGKKLGVNVCACQLWLSINTLFISTQLVTTQDKNTQMREVHIMYLTAITTGIFFPESNIVGERGISHNFGKLPRSTTSMYPKLKSYLKVWHILVRRYYNFKINYNT